MLAKLTDASDKPVTVEFDAPQGVLILVMCPDHGRMAESIEQKAFICVTCHARFTDAEWQKLRQQGFDDIKAKDAEDRRNDQHRLADRLAARRDRD